MHINKQMNDFVINLLKTKIPSNYFYHNHKHTLYVIDKVIEIGDQENCSAKELELLSAAALWHDTGYINTYTGHEDESCKLARQYLPEYGYTTGDIDKDFAKEMEQTLNLMKKFYDGGLSIASIHPHPFFGKLTPEQWGMSQYKHFDHHLKQFSL